MVVPNFFTSGFVAILLASWPASISTWFAVTTMLAIWASLMDAFDCAPAATPIIRNAATVTASTLPRTLLESRAEYPHVTFDARQGQDVPEPGSRGRERRSDRSQCRRSRTHRQSPYQGRARVLRAAARAHERGGCGQLREGCR